jgi:hypothetical protein
MRREVAVAAAVWAAGAAWAQQAPDFPAMTGPAGITAPWQEAEAPPPPALRTSGLVPLEVPGAVELRYGVDPASVAIGADRVVRFVVVASSRSGAVNAIYEGVRCDRGEYRVYARSSGQGWHPVEAGWKSLSEGIEAHQARAVAKDGACRGHVANASATQVVRDLRAPPDRKFGGSP